MRRCALSKTARGRWLSGCGLIATIVVATALLHGADCNGNGADDVEDVANAVSEDCNVNDIPDECEGVPVELGLGSEIFAMAPVPLALATADLDDDGVLDLVQGSRDGQTVLLTVLLGTGARDFAIAAEYKPAAAVYSIAIDDLDGDAVLDIATANSEALLVYSGRGDGTFAEPVAYEQPFSTRFVVTGDVDGDGASDLIATHRNQDSIGFRRNRGDGTLDDVVFLPTGIDPRAIVTGDFNGDDRLDLVTVNGIGDFTVLFSLGDGRFADPISHALGVRLPQYLKAADFDGDGDLDLAAQASNVIAVAMNHGDGTLAETVVYSVFGARVLDVGDFNGDGHVDLVSVVKSNTVNVRVNDGRGNFNVSATTGVLSVRPTHLAAGDYDRDGKLDVATASSGATRFLWGGLSGAVSVTTEHIPLFGCERQDCSPHSGTMTDLNGDGWLDAVGANTHPGSFSVLLNDGAGRMIAQLAHTFGKEQPLCVSAGDLDHDGDIDLVTCENQIHEIWVHLNNGDGTLERPKFYPAGGGPFHIKLADFNGDGHLDAAAADRSGNTVTVFNGVGDGSFLLPAFYRVGSNPRAVVSVDLDLDGDEDLAAANASSSHVSILMNKGDGEFEASVDVLSLANSNDITSGDVNEDGAPDLITADTAGANAIVFLNLGGGTFGPPVSYTTGSPPTSVIVVDFDLDGQLDVVTGSNAAGDVSILRGNGDGTFDQPWIFLAGAGIRDVMGGDLDKDGDIDLVTANRSGHNMTVLYNDLAAEERIDFFAEICTEADFQRISAPAGGASGADRFVKFTLHVGEEPSELPAAAFQNTQLYPLHEDFLTEVFPNQFPAFTQQLYNSLVGVRSTRQYFVGAISRVRTEEGFLYGFSVFARFNDPVERLSVEEVKDIYDQLRGAFRLEPLAYFPASRSAAAVEVAREWVDPGFPIHFADFTTSDSTYEPYTIATGIGRVRILDAEEFESANDSGEFSFQDILVLKQAPRDIEGVVSGVITAEPQGELSHVAVRTNNRGTPNAYVADAIDMFTPFEDKLVRLQVTCAEPLLEEVSPEEAQEWWEVRRPSLSELPSLDPDYAEFPTLEDIVVMDGAAGADLPIEARFGGKASGLARLQSILDGELSQYGEKGFAIPVRYYLEFMRSNQIASAIDTERNVTYEGYLSELFFDPEFQTDPRFRFAVLETLRDHMRDEGQVDSSLVDRLTTRIVEVFGSSTSRVRFRSSSNVEDAIEFNGAGLYDSTSVCAADDLDGDGDGPSLCQAFKDNERGVARGLKKVWASLWNFRAYEERAFYGIPPELTAMGVLVNRAFVDERANGVAFTGNPTNPLDRNYVVTAQLGEESVVSPEPGVLPEKDVLEVVNGEVVRTFRALQSSLLPRGNYVLSDDELGELGALLWHMDRNFPIDTRGHSRSEVLLDVEFKIEATGELAVKQVRPFLLTSAAPPSPVFELRIPPDTIACGMFDDGRLPIREYELKSTVRFNAGSVSLPTGVETFSVDIVEEVLFGPEKQLATPEGAGLFRVQKIDTGGDELLYRFDYEQTFMLPGGERMLVELSQLDFRANECATEGQSVVLDSGLLTDGVFLRSSFEADGVFTDIVYSACGHETLPLWEIEVELEDGTFALLEERYRPEFLKDSGPASLTSATVDLGGEHREVSDYWNLVYSAARHNEHTVHWVVFEPPMTIERFEAPVHVLEIHAPVPNEALDAEGFYLDENLQVLEELEVVSYDRRRVEVEPSAPFRRGDVDADGSVAITDAILMLRYLFSGTVAPTCPKSADADDSGKLNVSDPISILLHLFAGRDSLPQPFLVCGADPTRDGLGCGTYRGCD